MMNLDRLFSFAEELRRQAIGDPRWINEKEVFEYSDQSVKVVAILKILRAAQGVKALDLLVSSGLFIDMGVIFRCVDDCVSEVYFLLEAFPKTSANVDRFVKSFFEGTIDGFLLGKTEPVLTKKIRSAVVRVLKDSKEDGELRSQMEKIYRTFSGYVHANYAHIMEIYGGQIPSFNFGGVPSNAERQKRLEFAQLAYDSVFHAAAFAAHRVGLKELYLKVVQNF